MELFLVYLVLQVLVKTYVKGIANCLQDKDKNSRPFAFIALGGSTNSSTLVGHSYTYQINLG